MQNPRPHISQAALQAGRNERGSTKGKNEKSLLRPNAPVFVPAHLGVVAGAPGAQDALARSETAQALVPPPGLAYCPSATFAARPILPPLNAAPSDYGTTASPAYFSQHHGWYTPSGPHHPLHLRPSQPYSHPFPSSHSSGLLNSYGFKYHRSGQYTSAPQNSMLCRTGIVGGDNGPSNYSNNPPKTFLRREQGQEGVVTRAAYQRPSDAAATQYPQTGSAGRGHPSDADNVHAFQLSASARRESPETHHDLRVHSALHETTFRGQQRHSPHQDVEGNDDDRGGESDQSQISQSSSGCDEDSSSSQDSSDSAVSAPRPHLDVVPVLNELASKIEGMHFELRRRFLQWIDEEGETQAMKHLLWNPPRDLEKESYCLTKEFQTIYKASAMSCCGSCFKMIKRQDEDSSGKWNFKMPLKEILQQQEKQRKAMALEEASYQAWRQSLNTAEAPDPENQVRMQ